MDNENKKLSLLDEELDEESAKYIQESINSWKENILATLQEQVEAAKAEKLEELEEANVAYREELKEEYSDKLMEAVSELSESVKADATASILKNNPELKIFEQIKELVAPTLNEDFRANTYSDTIAQLAEENAELKREAELQEGAETLAELLAGYSEKTQNLVTSLIKEGNAEEVTEQFYNIMESLEDMFSEEEADKDAEDDEDKDAEDDEKEDDDEADEDDDDDDDDKKVEESYIEEGYEGDELFEEDYEDDNKEDLSRLKNVIRSYSKK